MNARIKRKNEPQLETQPFDLSMEATGGKTEMRETGSQQSVGELLLEIMMFSLISLVFFAFLMEQKPGESILLFVTAIRSTRRLGDSKIAPFQNIIERRLVGYPLRDIK